MWCYSCQSSRVDLTSKRHMCIGKNIVDGVHLNCLEILIRDELGRDSIVVCIIHGWISQREDLIVLNSDR